MGTLNDVLDKLFPAELQLVVDQCEVEADVVSHHQSSRAAQQPCPRCQTLSGSIHSRYERRFQHLPWGGLAVRVQLQVRRFRCRNCYPARTFAEQFPHLVARYARYSAAVCRLFQQFVLRVGGEEGQKLLAFLRVHVSGDRLLAEQHGPLPPLDQALRVIGIDDFAVKKGLRYGTVISNLETGRAIELLPDRKAATVIQWLAQHPEIEVISRDRSTEYERASREGAPQAVQVLDRWHVLKNFREALERQLKRSQQTLDDIAKAFIPVSPPRRSPREEAARRTRYERRWAEVAQIKALAAQGQPAAQIARNLRRSHHFVRFSLRVEQVPDFRHPPRPSRLDPHHERLWELWNAGERNAMALLRQVQQEGFPGGYQAVHQWTLSRRIEEAEHPERSTEAVPAERQVGWRRADFLAGQVVWLLLKDDAGLDHDEQALFRVLTEKCAPVSDMRRLALDFRQLFQEGNAQRLDWWLKQAASCGLPDIQPLATSLVREREALLAAMPLPWSNGPTEGVVNKSKLIKRQMYGRGSVDTLRQRVLLAS
jgi:transposase